MQQIINKEYLDKFKYYPSQTLFEPDLSVITQGKCPLCFNKLKNIKGKILLCDSKKHGKSFIKKI